MYKVRRVFSIPVRYYLKAYADFVAGLAEQASEFELKMEDGDVLTITVIRLWDPDVKIIAVVNKLVEQHLGNDLTWDLDTESPEDDNAFNKWRERMRLQAEEEQQQCVNA